jgi:hypothetical protein
MIKNLPRLLLGAVVLLVVACSWYPPIQSAADAQVDAGLKRALVSFATARTLNAVISVVQGTEVSAQPLGVGVTLTVGQVLDPINDLVEQFSSLMLVAAVSFGVQKALLAIGANWVVSALVSAVAVAWAVLHALRRSPPWLSGVLLVLLMTRFAVPVATLGSDLVFQELFAQEYREQQASIEGASREIGRLAPKPPATAEGKGWWDRISESAAAAAGALSLEAVRKSAEDLSERLIRLTVIFVLQTMVMPILLIWALYRLVVAAMQPARQAA